jgi:L-threonylcarbamoyladenylate synthase
LHHGGLIIYPTDTVYGLGALAAHDEAVRRLFQAKGRLPDKPLPLLLADPADVEVVTAGVPPLAYLLMERFWPGGLTLILRKSPRFLSRALASGDTVGVRVPDHPLLREVIRRAGRPITGSSANRSGLPSARTLAASLEQIGEVVELAIDGGPSPAEAESTVIDIAGEGPSILREGVVRREQLEEALGMALAGPAEPRGK